MFLAMFHHSLLVWTNTASGFSPAMRSLVLFASRVEELVVPMRYKVRPFDGSFSTVKVFLKGSNLDIDKNKKQRKNINFFSANPSETVAFQNHLAISCIFIHLNSFHMRWTLSLISCMDSMKMTETALITLFQLFGKYLFQGWGFSGTCEQRVR